MKLSRLGMNVPFPGINLPRNAVKGSKTATYEKTSVIGRDADGFWLILNKTFSRF
jgi:hypothetical protein